MAAIFIPEDGTGLPNANSYVDVAYADQYFLDRGVTTWTGADAVKQTALVRATDYVETRYGDRFIGDKFSETQALFFPLDGGLTDPTSGDPVPDPISVKLLKAICEYAVRALVGTLTPDPIVDGTGQRVQQKVETVGPITESTTYMPGGTVYIFVPYPAADILLRGLVRGGGGTTRN